MAMALCMSTKKAEFSKRFSAYLIAGFSTSIRLGVGISLGLAVFTKETVHDVIIASCTAFGAGTFIFSNYGKYC